MEPFLTTPEAQLLRREKCADFTADQFAVYLHAIERHRLDPFANQIYAVSRNVRCGDAWEKRITVQTGIDGFRLIADRTGQYAGNDDPVYDREDNPQKATVTVYKLVGNTRCPFTASARWTQYCPPDKQAAMWKRMPHLMLGKVAEALALRKAFPAELSALYTSDEMAQADESNNLRNTGQRIPQASTPSPPATDATPPTKTTPKTSKPWKSMTNNERFLLAQAQINMAEANTAKLTKLAERLALAEPRLSKQDEQFCYELIGEANSSPELVDLLAKLILNLDNPPNGVSNGKDGNST